MGRLSIQFLLYLHIFIVFCPITLDKRNPVKSKLLIYTGNVDKYRLRALHPFTYTLMSYWYMELLNCFVQIKIIKMSGLLNT